MPKFIENPIDASSLELGILLGWDEMIEQLRDIATPACKTVVAPVKEVTKPKQSTPVVRVAVTGEDTIMIDTCRAHKKWTPSFKQQLNDY